MQLNGMCILDIALKILLSLYWIVVFLQQLTETQYNDHCISSMQMGYSLQFFVEAVQAKCPFYNENKSCNFFFADA